MPAACGTHLRRDVAALLLLCDYTQAPALGDIQQVGIPSQTQCNPLFHSLAEPGQWLWLASTGEGNQGTEP